MAGRLTQTSETERNRAPTMGRVRMIRRRRGLTIRLRGGSEVQTRGDSTASRTPVANICENGIDLEQQVLIITIGSLLLK